MYTYQDMLHHWPTTESFCCRNIYVCPTDLPSAVGEEMPCMFQLCRRYLSVLKSSDQSANTRQVILEAHEQTPESNLVP